MPVGDVRMVVEGVPELRRMLRDVGGRELEKELGQVHKQVGQELISILGGRDTGVGLGAGAAIRPSASTREVVLRVGGRHRDTKARQWGREQIWPGGEPPDRPYLIGTAVRHEERILAVYKRGVDRLIRKAGFL